VVNRNGAKHLDAAFEQFVARCAGRTRCLRAAGAGQYGTFTADEIQQATAAGKLSITARDQQVDGQSTIELTGDLVPKDEQGTTNATAQPRRFWVSSTTYLPVRSETQDNTGKWTNDVDYTWLPPTSANEALLTVTIPAGLTKAN
jgi:hypothetical protein